MPIDGNGNYTLPTIYKATAGTTITTPQHNTPLEDIAAALSNFLFRDGRAPWTANQNANTNRLTNLGNGTAPTDAVNLSQLQALLFSPSFTGTPTTPSVADWQSYQATPAVQIYNNFIKQGFGFGNLGTNNIFIGWREDGSGLGVGVDETDVGTVAFQQWCKDNFPQITSAVTGAGDLQVKEVAWNGGTNAAVLYHYKADGTFGGTYLADREWANSTFQPKGNYQAAGNYQPAGNYQAAGDYATVSQLPLDASKRIQEFTASNVYSNTRVTFPDSFSGTPTAVIVMDAESGNTVLWCKAKDWDQGGFTFMANGGNTAPLISVIAIGPR